MEKLFQIILIIGAGQGIALSLVILFKASNRIANRILCSVLLVLSCMIFVFIFSGASASNFCLACIIAQSSTFFFFPSIFFYTIAISNASFKFLWKHSIHTIPFFLLYFFYFIIYRLLSAKGDLSNFEYYGQVINRIIVFYGIIYLSASLFVLRSHKKKIRDYYSNINKRNLHWLHFILFGQMIAWFFFMVFDLTFGGYHAWKVLSFTHAIFMYLMGYLSLMQAPLYDSTVANDKNNIIKKKYQKSTLTSDEADDIAKRLISLMNEQKIFLLYDISLVKIAEKLIVSVHHLSQVINEEFGKNFYEFINEYRIADAKEILSDPDRSNLTISSVCYDTGFNSVSSFNKAFKYFTGLTPSQYKNR